MLCIVWRLYKNGTILFRATQRMSEGVKLEVSSDYVNDLMMID